MASRTAPNRWWPLARGIGLAVGTIVILVLLMMWLIGSFEPKVGPATLEEPGRPVGSTPLATVQRIKLPIHETAVGTIRPVHEVSVASKLLAKVAQINLKAGQWVKAGEVLVRLDDADLKARREQAVAAVNAFTAARDQAKVELDRLTRLIAQQAASRIELDRARTAFQSAEAELQRATQQLQEADTVLSYATITSPIDGTVVDKRIEVGDTVIPGGLLVTLYDPGKMQLVASVRESLTRRLEVGQEIGVEIEALSLKCHGKVSEIVPEAESASRTFAVKVTGPCPKGVYPNMFGRLIIPLDEVEVLVVPAEAIRRVGQLETVEVAVKDRLQRRAVQLGRQVEGGYEVLSGLAEGEQVALSGSGGSNPAVPSEGGRDARPPASGPANGQGA